MSYCTKQHLIDAHGELELLQLTDRDVSGVIDNAVLTTALTRADSLINQRLRAKGWNLPLDANLILASNDLKNLAMDITRYYLHGHLNEIPKLVQTDFELALKTLTEYVKNLLELDIGSPVSTVITDSGVGDVGFSAPERIFTNDALKGF